MNPRGLITWEQSLELKAWRCRALGWAEKYCSGPRLNPWTTTFESAGDFPQRHRLHGVVYGPAAGGREANTIPWNTCRNWLVGPLWGRHDLTRPLLLPLLVTMVVRTQTKGPQYREVLAFMTEGFHMSGNTVIWTVSHVLKIYMNSHSWE